MSHPITAETAARILGTSVQMVRRLCREGRIVAVKHGRDWAMTMEALENIEPPIRKYTKGSV